MTGQRERVVEQMRRIFMPRAVAVIGASATPGKLGYAIVENLKGGGYEGRIYPVNPGAKEILGYQCYPSLDETPDDTDVAIVSIPAKGVAALVPSAAKKRVAGLVVISSGFAEIGEWELQRARAYGPRARGSHPRSQHLRLLLHAGQALRHLLHPVHGARRRGPGLPERRRRHGDPGVQPLTGDGRLGHRGPGQQDGRR